MHRTTATSLAALAAAAGLAGPAWAQTATDVSELVVTAERTNRGLSQVASSVAIVTAKDTDNAAGVFSTDDVVSRLANVVTIRPSSSAPAIRGMDGNGPAVGGNAFFAGTRARVNYVVDGRPLSYNEAIYIDGGIWDLQQIEVYRGPQSTLQGRNAIAGVIALKTADPTFGWQGKARVAAGGRSMFQASAAVGGPLATDVLAFRVSADYRKEDSFVDFIPFDSLYGPIDEPKHSRSIALRGKLLLQPNDHFRSLLTLSHTDAYAPQAVTVLRPFSEFSPAFPDMPRFWTRANTVVSDTDWRFSETVSLSALFSAADYRVRRYSVLGAGNALIDGREYAADMRLRFGAPDARLSGFIAGYLYKQEQTEFIDFFTGNFEDSTHTRAIFGELNYRPAQKVEVTLGARYEQEERDRVGSAFFDMIGVDFHDTFEAFLPRATVRYKPSEQVTFGATVGKGYNSGGLGIAFEPPFPSEIYARETVWNYELFFRGQVLDPRLSVSANVFYNDYSGLQLPFDVNPDPAVSALVIRNADRATTYGAEVEARFQFNPDLAVFAQAGLLKTKVNEYNDPTVEGNDLLRSPAFTFSGGLTYAPPQGFGASVDVRYTDAYYSDAFNDPRGKTDAYAIVNAQVSYRVGPARLFAAVTNIFDEIAVQDLAPGVTRAGDVATVTAPRRASVGIDVTF